MVPFIVKHKFVIGGISLTLIVGTFFLVQQANSDPLTGLVTTTVERGTVESIVSVSGITEAKNAAELAFAAPGTVTKVYVTEGSVVQAGDVLATLGADALVAARASAVADLRVAEADRAELLAGDTTATRDVESTKVAIAAAELQRVITTEKIAVENAKRTLRSSDLSALAEDSDERAPAPIISGSYSCDTEGAYTLDVYNSNAPSGFSLRYAGIEAGIASVSTDQPAPIGTCGLYALFTEGGQYSNSKWTILIPNTTADSYTVNKNNLVVAEAAQTRTVAATRQALTLAELEETAQNAAPRSEEVTRANARISKANAQIEQINAQIGDRVITAPFDGVVTAVDTIAGESVSTLPVITLLATDTLELTARIPEIDITRITVGQPTRVIFDADSTDTFTGTVMYISLLPIQIDGVAYFEVKIMLDTPPTWLRGGLNCDIDIITASTPDVLRVPKRYVVSIDTESFVRTLSGTTIATTTIKKIVEGNDGFVAIEGITEGTVVVTP